MFTNCAPPLFRPYIAGRWWQIHYCRRVVVFSEDLWKGVKSLKDPMKWIHLIYCCLLSYDIFRKNIMFQEVQENGPSVTPLTNRLQNSSICFHFSGRDLLQGLKTSWKWCVTQKSPFRITGTYVLLSKGQTLLGRISLLRLSFASKLPLLYWQ
jgi:hypothetical protein